MKRFSFRYLDIAWIIILILLGCYLGSMGMPSGRIADTVWAVGAVAQPVFSPQPGSYLTAQTVTVTCATPGATIRYTKDGTTPTTTSPAIVSGGTISVTKTMTLKARAWKTGYTTSPVMSGSYEIRIVATPTLSVASGTYTSIQKVTVSCTTPDAAIHYTTNGIDPTESDPTVVSGSTVTVDRTMNLKTRAFMTDWTPSGVKSALYTIKIVDAPVFAPDAGSYLTAQSVIVTCPTAGATIRYTKDGTTPTTTSPMVASGTAINVTKTTVLKAKAWKTGYGTSPTKSANYEMRIVATPTLSVVSGTYTAVQKVVAACATPGAAIHYTTDGADPVESDPAVESGSEITVDKTMTLKVRAFKEDWTSSAVKAASYTINIVHAPAFSPDAGSYLTAQQVTVTCPTPGATIRYTKDGTTPTTTSPTIGSGGTINVTKTMVLKAKAWKTGYGSSPTKTANYEIRIVAAPTLSVAGGTYTAVQKVAASCSTPDAVIHYTTNGVEPTEFDPPVEEGSAITVDKTMTLKVKAFKDDWTPSSVKSAAYTINIVEMPVFSSDEGSYLTTQQVTVTCPTPGATIRYTKDGTTPTISSPIVASGGMINVTTSMTLKARAWKTGYGTSSVKSADYEIRIVATPTLSVASGTYTAVQKVAAACTTPGAVVRYTTNGVEPTEDDPIITTGSTITVDQNMTLKVKAFKENWTPSSVKSAVYAINVVRTPVFSLDAGVYLSVQHVTVTCATPGATIRYTTDGTTPTTTSQTIASGEIIDVLKTMTIKAKAWKTGLTASETAVASYEIRIVATPWLNVESGIYTFVQNILVTCDTPGAVIHYTKNGNDPTENDPIVESGALLTVDKTMTLKVKAFKEGWAPSDVKSEMYTINIVETPEFDVAAGTYAQPQQVAITCATPGATIHYTTDGTRPTQSSPTIVLNEKINVSKSMTLNAMAWKDGFGTSAMKSAFYEITIVEAPALSVESGSYTAAQNVVITCPTPAAVIRYTLNGEEPTEHDPFVFSGESVTVDRTVVLKAKAFRQDWTPSETITASYVINIAEKPEFNPGAGSYAAPQQVTVTSATPGATIYYTTDGTTPTTSSQAVPSGGLSINKSMTIKAMACKPGFGPSLIASVDYEIRVVDQPSFSIQAGTYTAAQNVILACDTPGAVIHYTTNGVDPTVSDPAVTPGDMVVVGQTMVLKAKAFKDTWTPSDVAEASYVIKIAEAPVLLPNGGTFITPQNVTITCPTAGATIRYTTDGSEPTMTSTLYTNPIVADQTMTIKAKAWATGYGPSSTTSADFVINIVQPPAFGISSGSYSDFRNVIITCPTTNAVIHYTLDGNDPTETDPVVASGNTVRVAYSLTLKAKAFMEGWGASPVTTATFTITKVMTPTLDPTGGEVRNRYVTVRCETPEATIRYTTNGSDPTTASTMVNNGQIPVTKSVTIKVKAWKGTLTPSGVAGGSYVPVVAFEDSNLDRVVREAIGKPSGTLYPEDFDSLTALDASDREIASLEGIQWLTKLTDLNLSENQIADLAPLSNLTSLKKLDLSDNRIFDLQPLKSLINLEELYLNNNHFRYIAALAGLTNLKHLELDDSLVLGPDHAPLASLSKLEFLSLKMNHLDDVDLNPIRNITSLRHLNLSSNYIHSGVTFNSLTNLEYLNLNSNEVHDLSGLSGMISLKELYVSYNYIFALNGLSKLANLQCLDVSDNHISDLAELSGLTNLTYLDIEYNKIIDLTALTNLVNLETLKISNNPITNINVLAGMSHLTTLVMYYNTDIKDFSVVNQLTGLRDLTMYFCNLTNSSMVTNLRNLVSLNLGSNSLKTVPDLTGMTQLKALDLSSNGITDITPIARLTNLTELDLTSNRISDFSPLASLVNLIHLELSSCGLKDTSAVSMLTNLRYLKLDYNQITDLQGLTNLTNLESLYLYNNQQLSNIQPLSGLSKLRTLELDDNSISNVDALSHLYKMYYLSMRKNKLTDIQGLKELKDLRTLDLGDNAFVDLSPIANLYCLKTLFIVNLNVQSQNYDALRGLITLHQVFAPGANIGNLNVLSGLTSLESLNFNSNPITDFSPVAGLDRLVDLEITGGITVRDLSFLTGLQQTLRTLELNHAGISNLDAITDLSHLHSLWLENDQISNLAGLSSLTHLNTLYVDGNLFSDINILTSLQNLISVNITNNPNLNTSLGSSAYQVIQVLKTQNCSVSY